MKKCLKILLVLVIATIIGLVWLHRYLQCHPIFMGGGPSGPRPERCYAKQQEQQRKNNMAKREQLAALEFSCKKETLPPISEETQQLYNYALYHDLHNMWTGEKGDETRNGLARYYRIAAMNGDYKANLRLQYLLKSGRISSNMPQTEVHNLNEVLAKQLPATAYYKLYGYLDVSYGVRTEADGKYAYLRKAADLGSREAQYVVAEMLGDIEDSEETEQDFKYRLNLVRELRSCASEQGLGEASGNLGISLQLNKKYSEAVKVFHQGVKNGDVTSALNLSFGFSQKTNKDSHNFLDLAPDEERSVRYNIIKKYLSRNDYLKPKVPDLDEIVPLPPAPLPDWDGKIAFQRWFEGEA
ncbi:sel1 repeat family protein, partial [Aggregatibacter actinomycetemcomitans]|uniref:SEL1-like repeat protein n=1 Tax=Aggregatibacter actinomycetemcomitans TaxID=714 RepID=UPI00197B5A7A